MDDLDTLKQWLADALAARQSLMTGGQVQEVWRDGRRMKFTSANLADLNAYITDLYRRIAELEGADAGARPYRRYIGVSFG